MYNEGEDQKQGKEQNMVELYLLEQLTAFQKYGTLSAASEALHLTQPSLSRSMKKLEEELGVPLFVRQKNRLTLNDNGKLAASLAADVLRSEEAFVSRVRAYDRSRRAISIGYDAPGPSFMMGPLLGRIYPQESITSEIREDRILMEGMKDMTYNMIVMNHLPEDAPLYAMHIMDENLFLSIPDDHPLAEKESVTFEEVNGETFLLAPDLGIWNPITRKHLNRSRFLVQDDLQAVLDVANASRLPGFATNVSVRTYQSKVGGRVLIPFSDEDAHQHFWLIMEKKSRPRFAKLIDNLRQ